MFAAVRKFTKIDSAEPIDDFESLLYLIVYCLSGFSLPWMKPYFKTSHLADFQRHRLTNFNQDNTAMRRDLPPPLISALNYVWDLNLPSIIEATKQRPNFNSEVIKLCLKELKNEY